MCSTRHLLRASIAIIAIAVAAAGVLSAEDRHPKTAQPPKENLTDQRDLLLREPAYRNKPLSYWLGVLRSRDPRTMSLAFDAIRTLGPEAAAAVPDLTRLVAAPFTPIHIGNDSREKIASKLVDISVRAEAIDTLSVIGEAASTSTMQLVRWALTQRVVPGMARNADDDELFIELVMMDTEQRMQVIGAIAEFGPNTAPVIAALVSSHDAERRKLGVAILSQGALPIAAELLRSSKCDERTLGFQVLKDLDLVVAKRYLDELMSRLVCDAN